MICINGSNMRLRVGDSPNKNPSGVAMAMPTKKPWAKDAAGVFALDPDGLARFRREAQLLGSPRADVHDGPELNRLHG
jgi:hypothetical protein